MCNHAKTFNANKSYKLAIDVFIPNLPLSKYKYVAYFPNVIYEALHNPPFHIKMNYFSIGSFFRKFLFYSGFVFNHVHGPGPGPVFRQCLIKIYLDKKYSKNILTMTGFFLGKT